MLLVSLLSVAGDKPCAWRRSSSRRLRVAHAVCVRRCGWLRAAKPRSNRLRYLRTGYGKQVLKARSALALAWCNARSSAMFSLYFGTGVVRNLLALIWVQGKCLVEGPFTMFQLRAAVGSRISGTTPDAVAVTVGYSEKLSMVILRAGPAVSLVHGGVTVQINNSATVPLPYGAHRRLRPRP
jgi:hypothetical protein